MPREDIPRLSARTGRQSSARDENGLLSTRRGGGLRPKAGNRWRSCLRLGRRRHVCDGQGRCPDGPCAVRSNRQTGHRPHGTRLDGAAGTWGRPVRSQARTAKARRSPAKCAACATGKIKKPAPVEPLGKGLGPWVGGARRRLEVSWSCPCARLIEPDGRYHRRGYGPFR